jgi:hypothetical protein
MTGKGWGGDHVGKLHRLQTAVRILAEGRGKTAERIAKATEALIGMSPRDFPQHLRNRAIKVTSLRGNAAAHVGNFTYFRFEDMTVSERTRFVGDLLALYEACLIDLGRSWPMWDFMYPKDTDVAPTSKERKRHSRGAKAT